jgi:RHS repeat-associated protein
VHGGAPAGRLRQEVYLIPGEYQLFLSAKRVGDRQHSIRAAVAGPAGTIFPLTTNYATYQVATTYTISTPGVYTVIIDSVANYTTDVACIEEVRLVALNKRPIFSAFHVAPLGTVHEPAPSIAMSATASDPDTAGHVAAIEFLVNGQEQTPALKCVNDTTPPARPFTCAQNWLNAPPGQTHVITARAIDDRGADLGTTTHTVTHSVVVNAGPVASLTYPTAFLSVPSPFVALRASVVDPEGDPVSYVEFRNELSGSILGRVNTGQAATASQPAQVGNEYVLNVVLEPGTNIVGAYGVDVRGARGGVDGRQFVVNATNQAPSVRLVGNNETFVYGSTNAQFSVSSHDYDGQIVDVWIEGGIPASVRCRDRGSPTHCSLEMGPTTPADRYTIRGRAIDNLGKVGWSGSPGTGAAVYELVVERRLVTCTLNSSRPNGVLVVNADNILNVSCKDLDGNSIGLYTIGWDAPASCSNSFVATDTEVATCIVRPTSTEPIVFSAYIADSNNESVNGAIEKTFTPIVNQPPTISLVSPGVETAVAAPATFTIAVSLVDPEGSIKRVELINVPPLPGATPPAAKTAPPWSFTWSNVPAGIYTNIKARVYDEFDVSAEVAIPTLISNALPSVTITAPASGSSYAVGAQASFSATATDVDGTVTSVEYTATPTNSSVVANRFIATAPGFPFTWSNLPNGDYLVTARATDNRGMQGAASTAVTIRVNSPPTIRLESPANGTTIPADGSGARVQFSATNVSDPDAVASVVFEYSQGWNTNAWTLAANGSGAVPNYSAEWQRDLTSNTNYSVRACATDERGQRGCSTPANITVQKTRVLACILQVVNPPTAFVVNQTILLSASCKVDGVSVSTSGFDFEWLQNNRNFWYDDCPNQYSTCSARLPSAPETILFKVGVTANGFPIAYSNEISVNVVVSGSTSNAPPTISQFALTSGVSPLTVTSGAAVSFSYNVADTDTGQNLVVRAVSGDGTGDVLATSATLTSGGTRSGTLSWVTNANSAASNVIRLEVSDGFVTVRSTNAITVNVTGGSTSTTKLIYIHPDVKGSPLMATSAVDGVGNVAVLWREDYSAFGMRRKNEVRANDGVGAYTPKGDAANSLWYIGKPQDNVTGLVYFGARWYDPQVGRFLGVDPAGVDEGNPHSFNRYAYGNNNPYKYLDPDGRAVETVWDAASLAMGVHSASQSYAQGKWGALFVDAVGIVADAVATVVPVVPGGAGVTIAAVRGTSAATKTERATTSAERVFYHYRDEAGAKAIQESGVIKSFRNDNKVFLTDQKLSKDQVPNALFIGNSGTRGSHRVEVKLKEGVDVQRGKNNEYVHNGSIRDGRQADLKVTPNE